MDRTSSSSKRSKSSSTWKRGFSLRPSGSSQKQKPSGLASIFSSAPPSLRKSSSQRQLEKSQRLGNSPSTPTPVSTSTSTTIKTTTTPSAARPGSHVQPPNYPNITYSTPISPGPTLPLSATHRPSQPASPSTVVTPPLRSRSLNQRPLNPRTSEANTAATKTSLARSNTANSRSSNSTLSSRVSTITPNSPSSARSSTVVLTSPSSPRSSVIAPKTPTSPRSMVLPHSPTSPRSPLTRSPTAAQKDNRVNLTRHSSLPLRPTKKSPTDSTSPRSPLRTPSQPVMTVSALSAQATQAKPTTPPPRRMAVPGSHTGQGSNTVLSVPRALPSPSNVKPTHDSHTPGQGQQRPAGHAKGSASDLSGSASSFSNSVRPPVDSPASSVSTIQAQHSRAEQSPTAPLPSVPPYSDRRRRRNSLVLTQRAHSSPAPTTPLASSEPLPASSNHHSLVDLVNPAAGSRASMTPIPANVPPMDNVWLDDEDDTDSIYEDLSRPSTTGSKRSVSLKHWSLNHSKSSAEKLQSADSPNRKSLSASLRKGLHWKRREDMATTADKDFKASSQDMPKPSLDTVRSNSSSNYQSDHEALPQPPSRNILGQLDHFSALTEVPTNTSVNSVATTKSSWKFWAKRGRQDSVSSINSSRRLEISAPTNLVHMTKSSQSVDLKNHHSVINNHTSYSHSHSQSYSHSHLQSQLSRSSPLACTSSPANSRPASFVSTTPTYTARPQHLSDHSTSSSSALSHASSPSNNTTPNSDFSSQQQFFPEHPVRVLRNQESSDSFGWVAQTSDFVEQQKWLMHHESYDSDLAHPPQVPPLRRPLAYGERKKSVLLPSAPIMDHESSTAAELLNIQRASRVDLQDVQEESELDFGHGHGHDQSQSQSHRHDNNMMWF